MRAEPGAQGADASSDFLSTTVCHWLCGVRLYMASSARQQQSATENANDLTCIATQSPTMAEPSDQRKRKTPLEP